MQYIETLQYRYNKLDNTVCGDDITVMRTKDSTVVIVMDGIGSGIRANLCATLFGNELVCFLEKGYSLLEACRLVVETIKIGKKTDNFAAFSAANILHNGYAQMVTYEGPEPVFINNNFAYIPQTRVLRAGGENLIESNCLLGKDKALLLFSDGLSQSGMGHGFGYGIGSGGVADKLNEYLVSGIKYDEAVKKMLEYCKAISEDKWEDDTSLVIIKTRNAVTANILTGPPSGKNLDEKFINDFNKAPGLKIVCGSTTLDVYARVTKTAVKMQESSNPFEAPTYKADGLNFASEGALMLNQLYNLYELNPANLDGGAPIARLKELIDVSDKITFFYGAGENKEQNDSMMFSQLRIFPRAKIIKLLTDKFKQLGKVVVVHKY
ncbi:MAG: SpoIIE family protein phosphatase [Elusimicrobium sp.]|jgi:hypothetical protein|nr:SpoIIE family protein phosphatase [Elusimicrobium sp.]